MRERHLPEVTGGSKSPARDRGLGVEVGRRGLSFKPFSCPRYPLGNKHKWVPLQIDMKPEVPREKLVSRPTRPPEPRHTPTNRGEIKGMRSHYGGPGPGDHPQA